MSNVCNAPAIPINQNNRMNTITPEKIQLIFDIRNQIKINNIPNIF